MASNHNNVLVNLDPSEVEEYLDIGTSNQSMEVESAVSRWIDQWSKFCELVSSSNSTVRMQMDHYYRVFENFLDFRQEFRDIIERTPWDSVGPEDKCFAGKIVHNLREKVDFVLSENQSGMSLSAIAKLRKWQEALRVRYYNYPMELVQDMLKMLQKEYTIIQLANGETMNTESNALSYSRGESLFQAVQQILEEISALESDGNKMAVKFGRMLDSHQNLMRFTHGNVRALDGFDIQGLANPEHRKKIAHLQAIRNAIVQDKSTLIYEFHQKRFASQLQAIVTNVKREIAVWQRYQAYGNNGKYFMDACDIDHLEDCCKRVASILTICMDQINKLGQLNVDYAQNEQLHANAIAMLTRDYEIVFKDLVENALVVEKQPPQVLMKDKKFSCQLRYLVGDIVYNPQLEAKVSLINTETALSVLNGDHNTEINLSGKIINNSAKADRIEQSKQLLIHMRNMSLSMRQRGDRGRADSVAEEKFCMIFRYPILLRLPSNQECSLVAQTMSLPIVVISHGKQEADAQATIFWDNAFSEIERKPFEIPNTVPWTQLLQELDFLWKKQCHGQGEVRGLDDDAKRYLTIKLWSKYDLNVGISWRQFNRDNLPGKTFTFWTWFFKAMELVSSSYVREFWNKGYVKGFIGKEDCRNVLLQCRLGTFMFRFSDSSLGALSISCYTFSNYTNTNDVGHLEPDTIAKFKTRKLPDTVRDIKFLLYLYPNHMKDDIFGPYYTAEPTRDTGYWPKRLEVVPVSNNIGPTEELNTHFSLQSPPPLSPESTILNSQQRMNTMPTPSIGSSANTSMLDPNSPQSFPSYQPEPME